MEITGRRRLMRRMLRACVMLAAAAAMIAGSASVAAHSQPSAHHALADDGVLNSRN